MRLWTNIFLPVKALLEFLLTFKDETIAHKLNDTHKSNDSLLLPGAFAYWAGGRLSLCLATAGADKSQKPLEIRAFWQKERTATLIRIVSKLRFLFGGAGGNRTPVRKQLDRTFSGRRRLFTFPRRGVNRHTTRLGSFIVHGALKALRTHGYHSNHTLARLVVLPGRMGR